MEGSFGWGWVVDLKFVFHSLKLINTDIKYFLLKVEISNPGVLKESIAGNEKQSIWPMLLLYLVCVENFVKLGTLDSHTE